MVKTVETKRAYVFMIANSLRRFGLSDDVRLYIGCQFALESDFGTSTLAVRFCNHCGMKVPSIRMTTCVNVGGLDNVRGFARYVSLSECVLDYVLWLQYCRIGKKAQNDVVVFERFLEENNYCPESDYTARINKIFVSFK